MAQKTPARLLVILGEDISVQMSLPRGIPESVGDLISEIKTFCSLQGDIWLQYMDTDFGNIFTDLTSTTEITDLSTIKVIHLADTTTLFYNVDSENAKTSFGEDIDSVSVAEYAMSERQYHENITLRPSCQLDNSTIPSSSSSEFVTLRTALSPRAIPIPTFSAETELQLQKGNAEFQEKKQRFVVGTKVMLDILQTLANQIYQYKAYPQDVDIGGVAEALVKKHPSLYEPESFNGWYGWKQRLKYKMTKYGAQLREHGSAEVSVNSFKGKAKQKALSTTQNKHPKYKKVNYYPSLPSRFTKEYMENIRLQILTEVRKMKFKTVREKMALTFAYRRREIVAHRSRLMVIISRWPALFQVYEIYAEFLHLTSVPLPAKFLAQLDRHSDRLKAIISQEGGEVHVKTSDMMKALNKSIEINMQREFLLKSLIIFLGEEVGALIKEFVVMPQTKSIYTELEKISMGIFVICKGEASLHPPMDIGIVIDGVQVLNQLSSIALACALLFGLIYNLNLEYPKGVECTFEVIQKIFLELDVYTMSSKVHALSVRLLNP